MRRILLVQIVQILGHESGLGPQPPPICKLRERITLILLLYHRQPLFKMPWQHPIKRALDKLHLDMVGDEEMAREAVPVLAVAQRQIKLFYGRQIDARAFVFVCTFRVDGEEAGDVEQAGKLDGLQLEYDGHRGVIVEPLSQNAGK